MPEPKLTKARLAGYGVSNLPISVIGLPIALYIPSFYSESLGLSLAAVGTLIALSRLTDVFTDPAIGLLSDRWQTRFGRRKPWLVLGTPLMMVCLWRLFVPAAPVSNLYLFVWLSLTYFCFTLVQIPYRAWGAELSTDYDQRSRVTGWRQGFSYAGLMIALIIPLVMAYRFDRPGPANALVGIASVVIFLLPIVIAITVLTVPDRAPRETTRTKIPMREGLLLVWRNDPFRRVVACLAFFTMAIYMTATLSFFFVQRVMEQSFESYAAFILMYYASSTLAIPIWQRVSRKIGKHRTVIAAIIWLSIWSAPIPLLGPDDFAIFLVVMVLKGSAVGALTFLPTSMAADIVDLDIAKTGKTRTGLYFSIWGMVLKAALALGVFFASNAVAYFGFDPSITTNTDSAKLAVAFFYSLGPAMLALVALPLLWHYPLTRERQAELREQIRRQAEAATT